MEKPLKELPWNQQIAAAFTVKIQRKEVNTRRPASVCSQLVIKFRPSRFSCFYKIVLFEKKEGILFIEHYYMVIKNLATERDV